MSHKRLLVPAFLVIIALTLAIVFLRSPAKAPTTQIEQRPETIVNDPVNDAQEPLHPKTSFNKELHSIDELGSMWQIVNKSRPLPSDYVPKDLVVPDVRLRLAASHEQMKFRKAAASDLKAMFEAAQSNNVELVFGSGYRSYALQKQFYDSYVARDGQAAADRYSAKPGTSEHQSGLSFDATRADGKCHLEECFGDTEQGKWLAAHAHEYGFTLRYKPDKEAVTGYQHEPWHFRYVGRELSAELQKTNQTLEEFFNL
jgi:D-alanyl-D-alanine carboxypeptidase